MANGRARLFGAGGAPRWYVLRVRPQSELPVSARLRRLGALDCWHPVEVAWRQRPRVGKKERYLRRIVPGYLFMCAGGEVAWHRMSEATLGKVLGVVGRDGVPAVVSDAEMARMTQMPKRLEALATKVAAARSARAAAEQVTGPCRASVRAGPFAGFVVDVTSVHAGIAAILLPAFRGDAPATAPVAQLRKIA